ncbi:MAG: hypothetical protein P9X27_05220 [Candidatus Kaelpia aquatica]|nr:hypothetical protein [Candidatus Kaelpia aquatica]
MKIIKNLILLLVIEIFLVTQNYPVFASVPTSFDKINEIINATEQKTDLAISSANIIARRTRTSQNSAQEIIRNFFESHGITIVSEPITGAVSTESILSMLSLLLDLKGPNTESLQDELGGILDTITEQSGCTPEEACKSLLDYIAPFLIPLTSEAEETVEQSLVFLLDYTTYLFELGMEQNATIAAFENLAQNINTTMIELYSSLIAKASNVATGLNSNLELYRLNPTLEPSEIINHIKQIAFRCIDLYAGNTVEHVEERFNANGGIKVTEYKLSNFLAENKLTPEDFDENGIKIDGIDVNMNIDIEKLCKSIGIQGLKDLELLLGFLESLTKNIVKNINIYEHHYDNTDSTTRITVTETEKRVNIYLAAEDYSNFSNVNINIGTLATQLVQFNRTMKGMSKRASIRFDLTDYANKYDDTSEEDMDIDLEIDSPCIVIALAFTGSGNIHDYSLRLFNSDSRGPPEFTVFAQAAMEAFGFGVLQEVP